MSIFNKIFNVETYKNFQQYRGIQNVYTPLEKISELTDFDFTSLISVNTKTIGILFNFEFIDYLLKNVNKDYISNINITFFYDSKFDLEEAKFIAYRYNFNNILFESIENFSESKNIKDLEKAMANKKFDIVFSNPPYNHGLDIKILNSIKNFVKEAVIIHPSQFVFDKKFKSTCFNEIRNTKSLKIITFFWGNKLFNIDMFMPLCISFWDFTKKINSVKVTNNAFGPYKYECDINEISIYGDKFKEIFEFKNTIDQIIKRNGSFVDHRTNEDYSDITDYSIKIAVLRGNSPINRPTHINGFNLDFFTMINFNIENNICDKTYRSKTKGCKFNLWSFSNEKERQNFINYCKTKIIRFCFSFYKMNQNITSAELKALPWMDFTYEWTDAKLCKEFGISEELWEYIDNFIPDYYDDYVSGIDKKNIVAISSHYGDMPSEEMQVFCGKEIIDYLLNTPSKSADGVFISKTFKKDNITYNAIKETYKGQIKWRVMKKLC